MEIIHPSFQILAMTGHPELPYQYQPDPELLIEACGRTCYKSEDKITAGSAKVFVESAKKRKHLTVLEHSWEVRYYYELLLLEFGNWNKYLYISKIKTEKNSMLLSGNKRAFEEAEQEQKKLALSKNYYTLLKEYDISQLAIENNEPFLMSATVRFINDRGVSHEQVRHRPLVVSQESTRYVNYGKKGMQVILPLWIDELSREYQVWKDAMQLAEVRYLELLDMGWSPQRARSVLPNSLKTELCITAPLSEWQHIFRQRALSMMGKAHEQMEEVIVPCWKEFEKLEPCFFSEEILRLL